jgi:hypothetical protein
MISALCRRAAEPDEGTEGDHQHSEHFRRAEAQGHLGEGHGEEGEQHRGDDGAEERHPEAGGERQPGLALLGQRPAVEHDGHRPGISGHAEQNRGNQAAIHRAPIDARQHHQRRHGLEEHRHRKQDRDPGGPADSRQHTHQQPQDHAEHHETDASRGEERIEPRKQKVKGFHDANSSLAC